MVPRPIASNEPAQSSLACAEPEVSCLQATPCAAEGMCSPRETTDSTAEGVCSSRETNDSICTPRSLDASMWTLLTPRSTECGEGVCSSRETNGSICTPRSATPDETQLAPVSPTSPCENVAQPSTSLQVSFSLPPGATQSESLKQAPSDGIISREQTVTPKESEQTVTSSPTWSVGSHLSEKAKWSRMLSDVSSERVHPFTGTEWVKNGSLARELFGFYCLVFAMVPVFPVSILGSYPNVFHYESGPSWQKALTSNLLLYSCISFAGTWAVGWAKELYPWGLRVWWLWILSTAIPLNMVFALCFNWTSSNDTWLMLTQIAITGCTQPTVIAACKLCAWDRHRWRDILKLTVCMTMMLVVCMSIVVYLLVDYVWFEQSDSDVVKYLRPVVFIAFRLIVRSLFSLCLSYHPSASFRCLYLLFLHLSLAVFMGKVLSGCRSWIHAFMVLFFDSVESAVVMASILRIPHKLTEEWDKPIWQAWLRGLGRPVPFKGVHVKSYRILEVCIKDATSTASLLGMLLSYVLFFQFIEEDSPIAIPRNFWFPGGQQSFVFLLAFLARSILSDIVSFSIFEYRLCNGTGTVLRCWFNSNSFISAPSIFFAALTSCWIGAFLSFASYWVETKDIDARHY